MVLCKIRFLKTFWDLTDKPTEWLLKIRLGNMRKDYLGTVQLFTVVLKQYTAFLSVGDVVSQTVWNRPICQAFRVCSALKPWLNRALYCERGCLSEVKKCCSKSIQLFLVAAAQISGCCQALTNRLSVLSALVISPSHCTGKINLGN